MVRRQGQSPSFHNGLAKIAPWPYLVGNASGFRCIGRCAFGGTKKRHSLRALRKISAAKDYTASPKSGSEPVNACTARLLFQGKILALLNRSFDCNATSRSREWNMFTVLSVWPARFRIIRL